jgi:hypothetical protein
MTEATMDELIEAVRELQKAYQAEQDLDRLQFRERSRQTESERQAWLMAGSDPRNLPVIRRVAAAKHALMRIKV